MKRQKKNIITSDDILGKDVIDSDGDIIGVSSKLHIDARTKQIVGITVDEGFMKPDLYVGLEYVKTLGVDSLLLKTSPKAKTRGLNVLDSRGRKVGVVDDVISVGKSNRFKAIVVKETAFSKPFTIKSKLIKEVGYSVILKGGWNKEDKR